MRSHNNYCRGEANSTGGHKFEGGRFECACGHSFVGYGGSSKHNTCKCYNCGRLNDCLPGSSLVTARGETGEVSQVPVRDLKAGTPVLCQSSTGKLMYSSVTGNVFADDVAVADFVKLSTASGHCVRLTDTHMLWADGEYTPAVDVRVGQRVRVVQDLSTIVESEVTAIDRVQDTGLYSPMTRAGSIVVNSVLVSCFSSRTIAFSKDQLAQLLERNACRTL